MYGHREQGEKSLTVSIRNALPGGQESQSVYEPTVVRIPSDASVAILSCEHGHAYVSKCAYGFRRVCG